MIVLPCWEECIEDVYECVALDVSTCDGRKGGMMFTVTDSRILFCLRVYCGCKPGL